MMAAFAAFALFSLLQIAFFFKDKPDQPLINNLNKVALQKWTITSKMNQSIFSIGKRSSVQTSRVASYLNHDSREMG